MLLHNIHRIALLSLSCAFLLSLSACKPQAEAEPEPLRPVRVVTITNQEGGETVTLTGQIAAEDQANLSFRISGRMTERVVNVGDTVRPGQIVARLESETARNTLRSARADLSAAQARRTEAQNNFERHRSLLDRGFVTRAMFDQADQALRSARAWAAFSARST